LSVKLSHNEVGDGSSASLSSFPRSFSISLTFVDEPSRSTNLPQFAIGIHHQDSVLHVGLLREKIPVSQTNSDILDNLPTGAHGKTSR
jgi:hypothetical protein